MLKRGDTLKNRYTVKQVIKTGENSGVYLVDDFKLLKEWILKEYTIKIESPQQRDISMRNFEKEATLLEGIKNSEIPEIADYFIFEGCQYLVMEHVKGKTLAEILDEAPEPLGTQEAIQIGMQIADALNLLHGRKPAILFRHLRPSHIIVTPDKKIKFIDFGLLRHFKTFNDTKFRKTSPPGYTSPEQFAQGIIDERADVYALGAILHQMLTLRNPKELSNAFKFPAPSSINPLVPKSLDEIISKATAYDPGDRYASVYDLGQKLEEVKNLMESGPIKKLKPEPKITKPEIRIPIAPAPSGRIHEKIQVEKAGRPFPIGKIAIITFGIFVILAGLVFLKKNIEKRRPSIRNTVESPYSLVKDKRILEYRIKGIQNYTSGIKSGNTGEIAAAISNLTKVAYAHPTDAVVQVYLENSYVLLKKKNYIKIAALLSLTGEDFESGMQLLSGISLEQARYNRRTGVRPVIVEIYDDKSLEEESISIAVSLSKRKDLLAVIGPTRSPFVLNTAPFFNEAGIVQITPTGTVPEKDSLGDCVFRTSGDGKREGTCMADLAVNRLKAGKIGVVFDPAQGYSNVVANIFINRLKQNGFTNYRAYPVSIDSMDYTKTVKEIKKFDPDAVFFVAYQLDEAMFARQIREAGIRAVHLSAQPAYSQQLISCGGKNVEGIIINSFFQPNQTEGAGMEFSKIYRDRFDGVDPNFRAALAYDTMLAICRGIERGCITPGSLNNFLKNRLGSKDKISGATGEISFDLQGRRKIITILPITVENGEFVLYKRE